MKTQILLTKTAILHTVITGFLLVTALNAGVHIKWTFIFNLIIIPILALILMGIDILVASKYKHNATKAEIISLRIKSPLLFFVAPLIIIFLVKDIYIFLIAIADVITAGILITFDWMKAESN